MGVLYFLVLVVIIVCNFIIAGEFATIADKKGYDGSKYGAYTFFFGIAGMLMVIALPQNNNQDYVHASKEKVKQEAEKEAAKREAEEEQLSISDLEDTASAYLKRRVSISDITCTLIYVIPEGTGTPKEMHLDMAVGDQEFTSLDLFFDQQRKSYYFKGRQLALDGTWRSAEEIFGFDVALFKSFNTEVDEEE